MIRKGKILALVLCVLLLLEVSLSFAWPRNIPRLAVLPRPPGRQWSDGCNGHGLWYTRSGVIWAANEASTLVSCR